MISRVFISGEERRRLLKIITVLTLLATVGLRATALEKDDVVVAVDRVYDTSWVEQGALKYGLVTAFCATQFVTGVTEGYHKDGRYLARHGNYHAYETVRRAGWMTVGWLVYANVRDADIGKLDKVRRIVASACFARNFFEWGYKWQRYNNPFDYTEKHNQCSLVYFKFTGGALTDAYIGTGPWSGPAVDAGFILLGWLLMK